MLNQQLANELYKPITKTFNKHTVHPSFKYMVCRPSWYAVNK